MAACVTVDDKIELEDDVDEARTTLLVDASGLMRREDLRAEKDFADLKIPMRGSFSLFISFSVVCVPS